ncbi:MAG: hypothetical protein JNK56_39175 [Myxococcales bacterium]|nr:hypothetical protein [Myxococcales bacterium]
MLWLCVGCQAQGLTRVVPETPAVRAGSPEVRGELWVANFMGDRVTRHDARTGAFVGELAATPELDGALGMDRGPDGRVYVASEESDRVLRYDAVTGAFLGRFVWDDPDTEVDETGGLKGPAAVLFGPDGALYVSSFDSDAVLRYDGKTGVFVDEFVVAGAGGLDGPDAGMVFGPDGDLYVPGFYNHAVGRYDGVTGEFKEAFTPADGTLLAPRTLIFAGDELWVTSERRSAVLRFDGRSGAYRGELVAARAGGLRGAAGMVRLADDSLAVVSIDADALLHFSRLGEPLAPLVVAAAGVLRGPTHVLHLAE